MRVTSSLTIGAGPASKPEYLPVHREQAQYRSGKQGGDERGSKNV